ncbi:N-6 DNA methylase [Ferroglobus placidus DSM 10642]|uniref:site-specific DNA-methyltransferase (adenine-specific) n=1 Tax=Ferroglobus placidus (strain DSM 10642 / AEDII12DO) TaxID=589924 RepID=D3S0S4_FERPA|nr:N-6 DNA methylase [Ferroglobus placidus DSM 10642]
MWDQLSDVENWVKQRYIVLAKEFGNKPFRLEDAEKVLKKAGIETGNVKELLSILRKKGLLEVEKDPEDFRRSIYRLLFVEKSVSPTRDKLFRSLKAGADLIRGGVDYKVLLLFLFYKALSDKWNALVESFVSEGHTKTQAYLLANRKYYVLYDENEQKLLTWHEVTKKRETLTELANALTRISRLNEKLSDLEKLVEILGFKGFISEDNLHTIESIIQIFNTLDFSKLPYDVIGDAYMWILNYFAPQKAKEGENYTPIEIVKLVVNLLDIEVDEESGVVTVLDPALGSGSMLIVSRDYVREKYGKEGEDVLMLYGQERNEIMGVIAKMNLILHDIKNYEIFIGDSLANPRFPQCDYVVANPPWNQDYNVNGLIEDPKVKKIYTQFTSTLPPKNSMDWGWIQLMLYFARKKVGIILDNGALFRGGSEKRIREAIVRRDLIEAVVLLPEKLFYNTGAPGCVIIFNKNKPEERKGKILFINASNEYEKHPEVRRLNRLGEKNIEKIVDAYREFKDIKGFARVVSIEEIAKNDYNLNVTLYVTPIVEEEEIDVVEEWRELEKIEAERDEIKAKLSEYVSEIMRVW